MKFVSVLLLIFLIELHNATENSTSNNVIRIPLMNIAYREKNYDSRVKRSAVPLDVSRTPIGNISIGTNPPQTIRATFDTGSSQLWVLSSFYDSCDENSGAVFMNHRLYNHSASPSFVTKEDPKPDLVEYTTGWVFGFRATDIVSIAGSQTNYEFLDVTKASASQAQAYYDSVVGLTYDPKHGNIVSQICKVIQGDHKFSFYFPKNNTIGNTATGELTLCGENPSKFVDGTMKYVDVVEPGNWHVKIDRIDLVFPANSNSTDIPVATKMTTAIDTGSNRIGVPYAQIDNLYQVMKAQPIRNSNEKKVDCKSVSSLPTLVLNMNGHNFTITHKEYIREDTKENGKRCRLLFFRMPSDGWNLGLPFLRKFYSVYDIKNHKIGLAENKE